MLKRTLELFGRLDEATAVAGPREGEPRTGPHFENTAEAEQEVFIIVSARAPWG